MDDVVILKWEFSPVEYFEGESIRIERDDCVITIEPGTVEVRVTPEAYDKKLDMRDELHKVVNACFLGVQMLTHKHYDLSKSKMERLHADGRRDATNFVETGLYAISGGVADMTLRDKNGNVISNSRRDRIDNMKSTMALTAKHGPCDPVAASLLHSYSQAVDDPANELVHLYEIRDALSKQFGGEKLAQETLGVSCSKWTELGQLANYAPLREGRHRGKNAGELRDATREELAKARGIALCMIESYIRFLEAKGPLETDAIG